MDITLKGLTKAYGDFKAVDNMSLHIEDGELIGLLGPSGCGKSTTLFMLAGLLEPTEGQILFGEKDVTKVPPEKREIGLVFQNYALYPHMTVAENIMFPLVNRKVPKAEAREKALEMAKLVQLDNLMDRKPKALSGGQQQRVAIARALVKKPEVLLLDEPLSNLDAKLRVETREEIRRIQQEVKITTIFVTHDQEEAMCISDKIAVMEKGIVQQYEAPQSMYLNPSNIFVANFLGMPQINMLDAKVENSSIYCGDTLLRSGCDINVSGNIKIGVRPESFCISDTGFEVTASHVRMTGRDLLIFFELGGNELRILVHSDLDIKKNDTFKIEVRKGQIIAFDEKGNTIGKY